MSDQAAPTPVPAPEVPPVAPAPKKAKGERLVRLEVVAADPQLAQRRIAEPWRRLAGMALDLVVVALLSAFSGAVLGFGTGLTLAALGDKRVSDTRTWGVVRWIFRGLGGAVMVLSLFLLAGKPLVRTDAFNLRAESGTKEELRVVAVAPNASYRELERAVGDLEHNVDVLKAQNAELKKLASGSSVVRWFADFGRTLGLSFGWAGVYFTLCTAWLGGRTLGKMIFGTRVVRLDGKPLTALDAFIRQGGYSAGLATGTIGFARLLWDANRQAIQDKIAWTVVLRT